MSTKTEEVKELVVLTPKQIEELPESVKDNVVFLTEKVGSKDLMKLNPMVTELIAIRNEGKSIAFIKADEEGKFDKSNIQEFVDIKKRVRTFRAKIKKVGTAMKMEPTKINKAIISIEKIFLAEATEVYDNSEKLFEPYIRAEKEKADVKQKEKDQALLDKIKEQKNLADETQLKLDKSNLYNKIKYELINGLITEATAEAVTNGSEKFVSESKSKIEAYSYELITTGLNDDILDESVVGELKHYYINAKQKAIVMLGSRLEAFEQVRKNAILESKQEEIIPPTPTVTLPENTFVTDTELQTDEQFGDYIMNETKRLYILTVNRINSKKYSTPRIHKIKLYLGNLKF